ncbi:MAG: hypothetical protein Q4D87_03360 [Actinomycetaceae bacterium]|nr:hypothetical protein [Actinomycetaceae bacterium]
MPGVPQWIADGPFIGIAMFLTVIVFLRSQATYWIAWLGTYGFLAKSQNSDKAWVLKLRRWLEGASVRKGVDAVDKWGLIIIPLSFLTIGFQTVVHAGAGVLRLRWWLYTLVAIPGYIAWGTLYAAVFIGLFKTGQAATAGKTWAIVVSTVFVTMLGLFILHRRNEAAKKRSLATVEVEQ